MLQQQSWLFEEDGAAAHVGGVDVSLLHIAHDTGKGSLDLGVPTHSHIPLYLTGCNQVRPQCQMSAP